MAGSERRFLFLLGSSRRGGNTETLAGLAAEQLPLSSRQQWLRLSEFPLPAFTDIRHEGSGQYPAPVGNEKLIFDATLDATDVVLATPLYWYSVSTATKQYLDHWSGWMRVPGADFKQRMGGKRLWAISVFADEDVRYVEPMTGMLRFVAEYMRMEWGGLLLGRGSRPGHVLADTTALADAKKFFA